METNHIYVNDDESRIGLVLAEADHFAEYQKLSPRNARRLRLLSEELIGLIRGIAGDYTALFWIEGDETRCSLHLSAKTEMSLEKREELIAASTSGKNAAAVGIVGKLRSLIEIGMQSLEDTSRIEAEMGMPSMFYDFGTDPNPIMTDVVTWSLSQYRENINEQHELGELDEEVWDELEKSVLANLADEVKVGVRKNQVDIIVDKIFA
ncbi:MAG: hypothetical protein IJ061_03825 [Lachnospiraceae bacterium]|nr:hypothetical protein [Lachnospiraceae bacterium]